MALVGDDAQVPGGQLALEAPSMTEGPWWDPEGSSPPLWFGQDAEPLSWNWFGSKKPELLVTARGFGSDYQSRVFRRLEQEGRDQDRLLFDQGEPLPDLDGLHLICPFPNDRVSRFDLVALGPDGLMALPNLGGASRPRFGDRRVLDVPSDLGVGPGRITQLVAVDWDGDGRIDLLVSFDSMIDYWSDPEIPVAQRSGFDLDGIPLGFDERGRWLGRQPEGQLYWLRNLGGAGWPRFSSPERVDDDQAFGELRKRTAALMISRGSSAAVEFALTDSSGELRLFRNFGGQLPPVLMDPRVVKNADGDPLAIPNDRTTLVAGDLEGNGGASLLFGTAEGSVYVIRTNSAKGTGKIVGPLRQDARAVRLPGGAVITTGDLDGNGGIDLVVGDAGGRLRLLLDVGEAGQPRYAIPELIEAGGLPLRVNSGVDGGLEGPIDPPCGFANPTLVDWNANGRLDLLITSMSGEVLYLRNNGHSTQPRFDFPDRLRLSDQDRDPLILPPRVRPALVDWIGNGLPDLLALDLQGFLCVWPRTDSLEVGKPKRIVDPLGRWIRLDGSFGFGGSCTLWAGPWLNGDRLDILVGIPKTSRFLVPTTTGERFRELKDLPTVLLLERLDDMTVRPRGLRLHDGYPVVMGQHGCAPVGVDWTGSGTLDLLVSGDDGSIQLFPREQLSG